MISGFAVMVAVAGSGQSVLSVYHFEGVRFAGLIAKVGKPQALLGKFRSLLQHLRAGCMRVAPRYRTIAGRQLPVVVRHSARLAPDAAVSSAWRTLLCVAPQFQTGMLRVAVPA